MMTRQRGETHTSAKLTEADVRTIRQEYRPFSKTHIPALAARYGVSTVAIWKVVHRETWAHLDEAA